MPAAPKYADTYRNEWARQAARQERVNLAVAEQHTYFAVVETIRGYADDAHGQWAQYAGYWDGPAWTLVRFTKRVSGKGGVMFEKGDYALLRAATDHPRRERNAEAGLGLTCATAYSIRRGWNCAVRDGSYVTIVESGKYDPAVAR